MRAPTATEVCRALRDDRHPTSGWIRWGTTGVVCEPREAWLASACMWVRANGRYATGWQGPDGAAEFFATRFGGLNAWRIRRALKAWDRRIHPAQHSDGKERG